MSLRLTCAAAVLVCAAAAAAGEPPPGCGTESGSSGAARRVLEKAGFSDVGKFMMSFRVDHWHRVWTRSQLTCAFRDLPPNVTEAQAAAVLQQVTAQWNRAGVITLSPVSGKADILISMQSGHHSPSCRDFTADDRIRADGLYPSGGEIHLNRAASWAVGAHPAGVHDLTTFVLHEMGHALGLDGNDDPSSAMHHPDPVDALVRISDDDVKGLQAAYDQRRLAPFIEVDDRVLAGLHGP